MGAAIFPKAVWKFETLCELLFGTTNQAFRNLKPLHCVQRIEQNAKLNCE